MEYEEIINAGGRNRTLKDVSVSEVNIYSSLTINIQAKIKIDSLGRLHITLKELT